MIRQIAFVRQAPICFGNNCGKVQQVRKTGERLSGIRFGMAAMATEIHSINTARQILEAANCSHNMPPTLLPEMVPHRDHLFVLAAMIKSDKSLKSCLENSQAREEAAFFATRILFSLLQKGNNTNPDILVVGDGLAISVMVYYGMQSGLLGIGNKRGHDLVLDCVLNHGQGFLLSEMRHRELTVKLIA
ncbi:MAG: hypothetical protein WCL61_02575 [bacterium]